MRLKIQSITKKERAEALSFFGLYPIRPKHIGYTLYRYSFTSLTTCSNSALASSSGTSLLMI